jgi:CRISPR/Cas system CSM-associated protein Csm3 (group 7 of RAMP superfamily)
METFWLCFRLWTDATFGRGEGLAGLVDQEVDHDESGLPYLGGRTLKGLLNEECASILYALRWQGADVTRWEEAAQRLLGGPGSTLSDDAWLRVGAARLPADLRRAVHQAVRARGATLSRTDVLDSLTTIRRQTAVNEKTGVPEEHTLRAMRVVLRETPFEARLTFLDRARPEDVALLAACVLALRRAGTGRNRGRGRLQATLHVDRDGRPGDDITRQQFDTFISVLEEVRQ